MRGSTNNLLGNAGIAALGSSWDPDHPLPGLGARLAPGRPDGPTTLRELSALARWGTWSSKAARPGPDGRTGFDLVALADPPRSLAPG